MTAPNEKKWDAFIAKYPTDADLYAHRKEMKFLAREGIPPQHRPRLWFVFSGAFLKREAAASTKRGYHQLVLECKYCNNQHTEQIEKDLHRTGLEEFSDPLQMEKLRRVLMAFAWRNPSIGYCQAMNFIAGYLILHMRETNAFWTLVAMIEDIMPPSYYDDTMKALHVDIRVFNDLVRLKLPSLAQQLEQLEIILHPIATIWFLGLFVHTMPKEAVCRVWDSLLLEGSKMLFRVGLGMLKSKQKLVATQKTFESAYSCLMEAFSDPNFGNEVMKISFDKLWVHGFSMKTIENLREKYTKQVEEEFQAAEMKRVEAHSLREKRKLEKEREAAILQAQKELEERERNGEISHGEGDEEEKALEGIIALKIDRDSRTRETTAGGGGGEERKDEADEEDDGETLGELPPPPPHPSESGQEQQQQQQDEALSPQSTGKPDELLVPAKYSSVYSHLNSSAFSTARRQSFMLMLNYANNGSSSSSSNLQPIGFSDGGLPATRRRGATTIEESHFAAAAAVASTIK